MTTGTDTQKKRALVTGGAGFIGSHVADRFLGAGYDVVVLDNLATGKRTNIPAGATHVEADVRSPEAAALVRDGGFSVIAHLAAQIDVRKSVDDPQHDAQVNVLGALNLMEGVRALDPARRPRVIFASTGGALYGAFAPLPTPETVQPNPDSPYGIAKLAVEHYLGYYSRIWGVDAVVLRFGNVYGPRQDPHGEAGVIAIFSGRVVTGKPLTIFGDGTQTRDYVYVEDVADAFFTVSGATLPEAGTLDSRAFNVGTGVDTSVNGLVEAIGQVAGATPDVRYEAARPGELARSLLDVSKAERVFGWTPKTPLVEGLRRTMANARAAG